MPQGVLPHLITRVTNGNGLKKFVVVVRVTQIIHQHLPMLQLVLVQKVEQKVQVKLT